MKRRPKDRSKRLVYIALLLTITVPASSLLAATPDSDEAGVPLHAIQNTMIDTLRVAAQNLPQMSSDEVTEVEPIVLRSQVKGLIDKDGFIEALAVSGRVFLPLHYMIYVFDLPIKIGDDHMTASGHVATPDRIFSLDMSQRRVQVGEQGWNTTKRDMFRYDGQIYVSTDSFTAWFGIQCEVDRSAAAIYFSTIQNTPSPPDKIENHWQPVEPEIATAASSSNPVLQEIPLPEKTAPDRTENRLQPVEPETAIVVSSGNSTIQNSPSINKVAADAPPDSRSQPVEAEAAAASGPNPVYTIELSSNGIRLAAVRNNLTLGTVSAFVDKQNVFLNLNDITRLMGLTYIRHETAGTADVVFKNGAFITLNFRQREFIEGGNHYSFYYNDIYKNDDEYYANADLLNRMFPKIGFVVDLSTQQVDLSEVGGFFGLLGGPEPNDVAPAPFAAPREPVVVDDSLHQQGISSSVTPEAGDVLHYVENQQTPVPSLPPVAPPEMPAKEENEPVPENGEVETLILQPRIKNQAPRDEFIEVMIEQGQVFIPLNDLLQLFEFPIKIANNNTASGFFITMDNAFFLDADKREARVADRRFDVTQREVRRHEGQLYISTEAFAEWFGINSELNRTKASIHFTTDKKLPQEEKEEREKRWRALMAQVEKSGKDYPLLQNPYSELGYPSIDVNLGASYTHATGAGAGGNNGLQETYNIQGSEEIEYLTGKFYAQGSSQNGALDILRVQVGKKDPDSQLLGPMQATDFAVGDVTSPSLSLVTTNSLGRGFTVTNRDVNAAENFDFRNFTGDSVPGYEVELYRNDVLVAFQTVDATGRYNFTNIPILYGENIFRIVFYGQQGQREERVETVSADSSLLKAGQLVYALGADQRGESLIPVTKNLAVNPLTPPGMQAVGSLRYGINRDFTVGAAMAETNLPDGEHQFATASAGANLWGVLAETDLAQDVTNNGWAGSIAALSGFEGVSLHARYRKFDNFISEAVNSTDTPLSSDTSFEADTQTYLPVIGRYSVGLSALHEVFAEANQMPRDTYGWRSSKSIMGVSFTDTVNYVIDEQKRFQDVFGVQTRIANINWRADGIYDFKPINQFEDASLMGDYKIIDKLSAQTQVDKNLLTHQTTLTQSFNWDFDEFRLAFTGLSSSNGSYSAGINLIFSINHDPASKNWRTQPMATSDSGAITGRIYIDENSNGKRDEGEPTVPEARIRINDAPAKTEEGNYFIAPVYSYQPNKLELDPRSINDPLLTPEVKGYRVLTRPGDTVQADFPLVRTTIIDGTVVFLDDHNARHEMGNIVVELEDADGKPVRRVMSEVDGYFSMDKIRAGEYFLSVPDEVLDSLNAAIGRKVPVSIKEINEFMTGNEIVLHQKQKLDTPPGWTPPAAAPESQLPSPETQ